MKLPGVSGISWMIESKSNPLIPRQPYVETGYCDAKNKRPGEVKVIS